MTRLEHVNLSVADAHATADVLCCAFGWRIRWQGKTADGDWDAVHVGDADSYIALFAVPGGADRPARYAAQGTLNHIGVVVDDLDAAEATVRAAGFNPHAHHDYEPGRRFYFEGPDGIEYEVVSYG
ncbi:VOC family protein [Primorskyibacter aestuariivivens]|uniref:VOC family protein n=1 Tax=Primorskyibacter aestuariivivens TaxID=1888912 RepID=UPI00230193E6|nr:VOC family protein [Primorskyibacter aestuariivivens]MDA7430730.1 VOC family protein [Primorskyibacter aestuariivivens]